jgi:hypothetical protein
MLSEMPETLISMLSRSICASMEIGVKAIAIVSDMIKIFFITYIFQGKDRLFLAYLQDFLIKKHQKQGKTNCFVLYNMLPGTIYSCFLGV